MSRTEYLTMWAQLGYGLFSVTLVIAATTIVAAIQGPERRMMIPPPAIAKPETRPETRRAIPATERPAAAHGGALAMWSAGQ